MFDKWPQSQIPESIRHIPVLNFASSDAATEAGLVMTV
ncbi:TPA: traX family protein, partial [Escherichia coli]|nr:traX family protein [Escherichia coli]